MNPTEQGVSAKEFQPALAARFYASESVFALERERLFHAQWFCVGRAEQVPARGDCLHVHVAGESVLVLRQKDDSLRAFYNVCRHRGSRLVRTAPLPDPAQAAAMHSVSLPTGVVCPYHAWTYNLDGGLRAAPYVQFDASCPKEGFSLVPVHAGYLGRIHVREPGGLPGAARCSISSRFLWANSNDIRSRICAAARRSSMTCARTGK